MQSNQLSGLIMSAAALPVTLAMGYFQFDYERDSRAQLTRTQGIDLLYLPGGVHWSQPYSAAVHKSFLATWKPGLANVDFVDTVVS